MITCFKITMPTGCQIESVGVQTSYKQPKPGPNGSLWTVSLEPYGLVAIRITSDRATIRQAETTSPPKVELVLQQEIRDLNARFDSISHNNLAMPKGLLPNPGFEQAIVGGKISDWKHLPIDPISQPGVQIELSQKQHQEGRQSLHVKSDGSVDWVWVRSKSFEVPTTGHLTLEVWARVEDPNVQPKIRLAIDGNFRDGQPYWIPSGFLHQKTKLTKKWQSYTFRVPNLPLTGLADLRVGFDMQGKGEFWIDDIKLYDLDLSENEKTGMQNRLYAVRSKLKKGQVAVCRSILDAYWPQFLEQHVPIAKPRLAPPRAKVASPPRRNVSPPKKQSLWWDRLPIPSIFR